MQVYINDGSIAQFNNGLAVNAIPTEEFQSTTNTLSNNYKKINVCQYEVVEVSSSYSVKIIKKH